MELLIRLDGVSKVYPRVHKPWERMRAFGSLLVGKEPRDGAEVLSDVSLEVYRGQSMGIIGENGAGKSTLLKVLTGVVQPSRGKVTVNTRTAALLELGAGFQPDFSGIDNVRMKASILGLSGAELDERLDDILAFADIGDYIHEPVKHYSSGMVVRLGFAVVTASQPELLITDEVLAVGDESFQKKCIRWIERFLGNGGTLLMVSHSMYLVQKLCQKAVWLHEGRARQDGEVFPVTQAYLAWHESRNAAERRQRNSISGEQGRYRISGFRLPGSAGDDPPELAMGDRLEAELVLYSPDGRPPVGLIGIVRADGTPVYGVASDVDAAEPGRLDEHHFRYTISFGPLALLPGSYSVRGHAMDPEGLRVCDASECVFTVAGESNELGFIRLPHDWSD
jgi:lipopolysaccharide transport system ATP-binding protein